MKAQAALARLSVAVFVAGSACAHPPVARPISWPASASIIEVLPVSRASGTIDRVRDQFDVSHPGEAVAAPSTLFIDYAGSQILARESDGRSVPLPSELAAILPGWVDGISIKWDREACLLGGHIERGSGHHLVVEGGFCFNSDTQTWRTVRLHVLPSELQPTYGSARSRDCRTVMIGNERALSCYHVSGGGIGSQCGHPVPVSYEKGAYRLVGLR